MNRLTKKQEAQIQEAEIRRDKANQEAHKKIEAIREQAWVVLKEIIEPAKDVYTETLKKAEKEMFAAFEKNNNTYNAEVKRIKKGKQ
jgi:F0F1-type ATP synthase membrane subunit b/b'